MPLRPTSSPMAVPTRELAAETVPTMAVVPLPQVAAPLLLSKVALQLLLGLAPGWLGRPFVGFARFEPRPENPKLFEQ